jgi:hypothetical protein
VDLLDSHADELVALYAYLQAQQADPTRPISVSAVHQLGPDGLDRLTTVVGARFDRSPVTAPVPGGVALAGRPSTVASRRPAVNRDEFTLMVDVGRDGLARVLAQDGGTVLRDARCVAD